jgi:hypothetical protein
LGFKCLIIDVKVEALAVILMVYVPVRHELPSFSVNCSVVAHLYLSDQYNLTNISTYCDRCWWIPVGPLGCNTLDEVDELS